MRIAGNSFVVTSKRVFNPQAFNSPADLKAIFNFAWNMTFGYVGAHRATRTCGQRRRKNGEIFINTFQGKLAEFAVYQELKSMGIPVESPDLNEYGLGQWDISDLTVNQNNIAIKSTKYYGNLLLLETGDWDDQTCYIPSNIVYDYLILVRISPDGETIMKSKQLLYSNTCDKRDELETLLINTKWEFDIAGFITKDDLKKVISDRQIIPQNAILNGKTTMDATNYFVEVGEMKPFNFY